MYLLDTNVVSETIRPRPEARVLDWLAAGEAEALHISVLTLGELEFGLALMAHGTRRTRLERWIRVELPARFADRVLPVDLRVARVWGRMRADGRVRGRPLPVADGLIVATAQVHGLTLVTRNVSDCGGRGVPTLDPWS